MTKTRVLLTGASGSMGGKAFEELLRRKSKYDIVLILRPSKKNKKAFKKFLPSDRLPVGTKGIIQEEGLKVVWGDLTHYPDVLLLLGIMMRLLRRIHSSLKPIILIMTKMRTISMTRGVLKISYEKLASSNALIY